MAMREMWRCEVRGNELWSEVEPIRRIVHAGRLVGQRSGRSGGGRQTKAPPVQAFLSMTLGGHL
jgi:hypothetical protein